MREFSWIAWSYVTFRYLLLLFFLIVGAVGMTAVFDMPPEELSVGGFVWISKSKLQLKAYVQKSK